MGKKQNWENIIRSKLENFEVDTHPDDWDAIIGHLTRSKRIRIFRNLRYIAAVIAGLLILSGGYIFIINNEKNSDIVKTEFKDRIPAISDDFSLYQDNNNLISSNNYPKHEHLTGSVIVNQSDSLSADEGLYIKTTADISEKKFITSELKSGKKFINIHEDKFDNKSFLVKDDSIYDSSEWFIANSSISENNKKSRNKRWGIGMGGGSYSVGTDGGIMPEFLYPTNLLTFDSDAIKASANVKNKQNVSHKRPISFGVGVGYALNDRWSLQSGLRYTMLKSEWWFVSDYQGFSKQKLHFLGIPVGINYKIAEWKKFRLYASAGVMTEWNMAGNIKTNFYTDNQLSNKVTSKKESIRMDEWQWSLNGNVGISYPLIRFVNAFAEGGANYYFDNGSSIETIRTDKPFHVSLQAGIRFGF